MADIIDFDFFGVEKFGDGGAPALHVAVDGFAAGVFGGGIAADEYRGLCGGCRDEERPDARQTTVVRRKERQSCRREFSLRVLHVAGWLVHDGKNAGPWETLPSLRLGTCAIMLKDFRGCDGLETQLETGGIAGGDDGIILVLLGIDIAGGAIRKGHGPLDALAPCRWRPATRMSLPMGSLMGK